MGYTKTGVGHPTSHPCSGPLRIAVSHPMVWTPRSSWHSTLGLKLLESPLLNLQWLREPVGFKSSLLKTLLPVSDQTPLAGDLKCFLEQPIPLADSSSCGQFWQRELTFSLWLSPELLGLPSGASAGSIQAIFPMSALHILICIRERKMKGMDHFHDRKIYPQRGSNHGIFAGKLHFYLNISFRSSPVHRPTRKSRNDLGEEKDVSFIPGREHPHYNLWNEWINDWTNKLFEHA